MTKLNLYDVDREKEEKLNVFTHFPGIILGALFVFILMNKEYDQKTLMHNLSYLIYGLSFITVFLASSIYHGTRNSARKDVLKKIDHASIFFFMGGCYTPFVVINMHSEYKFHFLAIVWILVVCGIVYKFISKYKSEFISLIFYVSFGFMCLLVKNQMLDNIPGFAFNFLLGGGALYCIGIFFYVYKKIPYHHGIWHVFVLLGASSHFTAIYYTV